MKLSYGIWAVPPLHCNSFGPSVLLSFLLQIKTKSSVVINDHKAPTYAQKPHVYCCYITYTYQ